VAASGSGGGDDDSGGGIGRGRGRPGERWSGCVGVAAFSARAICGDGTTRSAAAVRLCGHRNPLSPSFLDDEPASPAGPPSVGVFVRPLHAVATGPSTEIRRSRRRMRQRAEAALDGTVVGHEGKVEGVGAKQITAVEAEAEERTSDKEADVTQRSS